MPGPALRFLEYVFLALLYLFFLRVVRAVWVELREPRLVPASPALGGKPTGARPAGRQAGAVAGRKGKVMKLVVVGPDQQKGAAYPLAEELTIGRATGCAVSLPLDSFVSQVHARVFQRGDDHWVEDLGSTNGTLLNGRHMTGPSPLRRGDRVQVGRTVLELQK